jgi:hypothetical protein
MNCFLAHAEQDHTPLAVHRLSMKDRRWGLAALAIVPINGGRERAQGLDDARCDHERERLATSFGK